MERDQELSALMAQAQAGDKAAYERFLREATVLLRAFLRKRVANDQAVEDVIQETLLTLHRGRGSYLPDRPVTPWLFAICEHRMLDHFRRQQRAERLAKDPETISHLAPEETHDGQFGDQVRAAVGRLPGKQRRIIELLKVDNLSVKEVAFQLGMSESAVKVTAFRGYDRIRKIFGATEK